MPHKLYASFKWVLLCSGLRLLMVCPNPQWRSLRLQFFLWIYLQETFTVSTQTCSGFLSTGVSRQSQIICFLETTWTEASSPWSQFVSYSHTKSSTQKTSFCWEATTNAPVLTESTGSMTNVSPTQILQPPIPFSYTYITKIDMFRSNNFFKMPLFPTGKRRFNIKLWKTFTDCFNCLPIAAIVDEKIFCCHGGLSPDLQSMEQIRRIMRPTDVPDTGKNYCRLLLRVN